VRIEEFFPLHAGDRIPLSAFGAGSIWSELAQATTAEVLAEYTHGPVKGSVAVTRNRVGTGAAYYVGTSLDHTALAALLTTIAADAGLTPVIADLPDGVEAVRRSGLTDSWTFVINHSEAPAIVDLSGVSLITGEKLRDTLTVPAGGVSVVRRL
jgi:beta-galactosidase